jgi:hypothetical protein
VEARVVTREVLVAPGVQIDLDSLAVGSFYSVEEFEYDGNGELAVTVPVQIFS